MKIFTVAEAEETLPLVRRVVQDLIREYPQWREAVVAYEIRTGGLKAETGESEELVQEREQVMLHAECINDYLKELEQIGCVFKGFENGLVDFYALREDRLVFLCWRLGEGHVTHWHEVDAGYTGREPIDDIMLFSGSRVGG
ncbi:MAG: DUF2203 domain-containing protein [Gemmatimonadales bacterium]